MSAVPLVLAHPVQQPLPPTPSRVRDQDCDTITLIFLVTISAAVMLFNPFAGVAIGALVLTGWAISESDCLSSSSHYPAQRVYNYHAPYLPAYSPPNYYPSAGVRVAPLAVRTASVNPFSSFSSYSSNTYAQSTPGGRGAVAFTTSFTPPPSPSTATFQPISGGRGAVAVTGGISVPPPAFTAGSGGSAGSGALHAIPRR